MPIVFITGHGDIPMSVAAMKAGAADFLAKPFDVESLLQTVVVGRLGIGEKTVKVHRGRGGSCRRCGPDRLPSWSGWPIRSG